MSPKYTIILFICVISLFSVSSIQAPTLPLTTLHTDQDIFFWDVEQKIIASDEITGDTFGTAIDVDESHLIVGSPGDDDTGQLSGSAYVFDQQENSWIQKQKLNANDGEQYDNFGASISIDGNQTLIGAPGEDTNGEMAGAAYIFEKKENYWVQVAKLIPLIGKPFDYFGISVSITNNTAVIGAPGDDEYGQTAGAAYVFEKKNDVWKQTMKVRGSDISPGSYFGVTVSLSKNRFVAGAPNNHNTDNPGTVYVFQRGTPQSFSEPVEWRQEAILRSSSMKRNDNFGKTVTLHDNQVIVGAPTDDSNGEFSGSVYLFEWTDDGWNQKYKIVPDSINAYDYFGTTIAHHKNMFIITSKKNDASMNNAVYVYTMENEGTLENNGLNQHGIIIPSDTQIKDFGLSCSLVNQTIFIGAPGDSVKGNNSGSVFVFTPGIDSQPPTLTLHTPSDYLYVHDYALFPFKTPVILGPITVKAQSSDALTQIQNISLFINEELVYYSNTSSLEWMWNKASFDIYDLKIISYDAFENKAMKQKTVWKLY